MTEKQQEVGGNGVGDSQWPNGLTFLIVSCDFAKCSGHWTCGSSDAAAKMTVLRPRDQRIWWVYGRELLIVYPDAAKIDSYRHCVNGYKVISVCHVILQDHKIMLSCDFINGSHSM